MLEYFGTRVLLRLVPVKDPTLQQEERDNGIVFGRTATIKIAIDEYGGWNAIDRYRRFDAMS